MNVPITCFCLLLGISRSTWAKEDVNNNGNLILHQPQVEDIIHDKIECSPMFHPVGDHCLFVDKSFFGTWQKMRVVCLELGGDLPNLSNANLLADINDYLIANGLHDTSYWVGSNDQTTEGEWRWVNDHSHVKMGTPLWGDLTDRIQQPTGGSSENCGALFTHDHYYMHDVACSESYSLLCEEFIGQHTEVEDSAKNASSKGISNNTANIHVSAECPYPYEMFINKCIFINTLANDTWYNQVIFCEGLGGYLAKVDDANVLGAIYDRLVEEGITGYIWIGASDEDQEGHWLWHDSTQVRRGTPFWGDFGGYNQDPSIEPKVNCGYLSVSDHYFFHDAPCTDHSYAICQMDI